MSTTHDLEKISAIAHEATTWIGDQVLLSQGRCVDVFLDLYLATNDLGLRWSILNRLSEIRFVGAIRAEDMRADLDAIVGLATHGELIDMSWAEELVAADAADLWPSAA